MTSVLASNCVRRLRARERYNLNAISHDSAIGLIRMVIARGFNVTEVRAPFLGCNHFQFWICIEGWPASA